MPLGIHLAGFRCAWRRQQRAQRPKRSLRLEALEDRFVPSIIFDNATTETVTDLGGPVLNQVHVELIFWGSGWASGQGPALQSQVEAAVQNITSGPYVSYLSQYRSSIQSGFLAASVNITSSDPGSAYTISDVENLLTANIGNGSLPDPSTDPQLLYMVIPQPGSSAATVGNTPVGGAHDYLTIGSVNAHFGFTINPGDLDTITFFFSHELAESVTDPEGTAIQVNPTSPYDWNEISDPREAMDYSYRLNGYLVQSWFSQADHAFVVPTGQSQNFYVSSSRVLTINGDQLADPDDTITIDQANGGYRVTLNGETVQFASHEFFLRAVAPVSSIVVNPGTGEDMVIIDGTVAGSPITMNPGSGKDTVNIDGMVAGSSITINPGTGDDTVNIENTVGLLSSLPAVTVNLGDGTDTVNLSPSAQHLGNLGGGIVINGGSGADTLNLFDAGSTTDLNYTITSTTIARPRMAAITYSNLANIALTTSSGSDTITVQNTAAGTALALTGGGGNDTLVGSTASNTWDITGSNTGLLSSTMIAGPVSFAGVQNLSGQGGNDTFVFSDGAGITGNLDGGSGGGGTLDFSAYSSSVIVDLQSGTATGVGGSIANIQNVLGGNGGGASIYNILVGNGGNTLTGGNGRRNLLIAGASASTLLGGDDDDILIGGTTAYDMDIASLMAIMDYWSGTSDDYATRVGNLLSGNGVPLLDATMVTSNGGGNTLTGGAGLNLYYGNTADNTDFDPTSGAVFVPV
jgi:hypothetical protein